MISAIPSKRNTGTAIAARSHNVTANLEPVHIHRHTLGAVELKSIQADGWQFESSGPECANGWPCVFVRGNQRKIHVLSNDMSRWPDPIKEDERQLTLVMTTAPEHSVTDDLEPGW